MAVVLWCQRQISFPEAVIGPDLPSLPYASPDRFPPNPGCDLPEEANGI